MPDTPSTFRITLTPKANAAADLAPKDLTRDGLVALFSTVSVADKEGEAGKDGLAFIPADFRACPDRCRGAARGNKFDCKGNKLHRLGINVISMTGLALDFDHCSAEQYQSILEKLQSHHLAAFVWETYSHRPSKSDNRFRVFLPFCMPLFLPLGTSGRGEKWWSEYAWGKLIDVLGFSKLARSDSVCSDPAHFYYLPRRPSLEDERETAYFEGELFDWCPHLDLFADVQVSPNALVLDVPKRDESRPVNLEAIRERLEGVQSVLQRPIAQAVLKGQSLTPPPKKRAQGDVPRYVAWRQATCLLAHLLDGWEGSQAVMEILRPSFSKMVNDSPDDHTSWETIEALLETARASTPIYKAEMKAKREDAQQRLLRKVRERQDDPQEDDGWAKDLEWQETKSGAAKLVRCGRNVQIILEKSPDWRGVFRYNAMRNDYEIHGGPIFKYGQPLYPEDNFRLLRDVDTTEVTNWFQGSEYRLHMGERLVESQIYDVAARNTYDPLREYLLGLTWDGESRVEFLFERYFNARMHDFAGNDITRYVRALSRKWAISAVARGLRPGSKVDDVLILEGDEGTGKSTAIGALGGEFACETFINVKDKDAFVQASRFWLVEAAEIDRLFRNQTAPEIKAFVSKMADDYRPAYGRAALRTLRRCVYIGTTNKTDYFIDETGNRRYRSIRCQGNIDVDALKRDRNQIWAEAVALYDPAVQHNYWLNPEETLSARMQVSYRMENIPAADKIRLYLLRMEPYNRPEYLLTTDCSEIWGDTVSQSRLGPLVSKVMQILGFEKRPVKGGLSGYYLSDEMLLTPRLDGRAQRMKDKARQEQDLENIKPPDDPEKKH